MEGQTQGVAGGEEVGPRVQVRGYVVGGLGGEEGEEGEVGVCGGGEGGAAAQTVRTLRGGWGWWAGDGVGGRLRGGCVVEGCFWGIGVRGGGDGCETGAEGEEVCWRERERL